MLIPKQRGIALALTALFMFCGVGSTIAGRLDPVFGYTGLLLTSLIFCGLPSSACTSPSGLTQPVQALACRLIRSRSGEQAEVFQSERLAVDICQLNRG
jgi:MFS family permease